MAIAGLAAVGGIALAGRALAQPKPSTFDERLGRSPRNSEVGDPNFQYVFHGTLRGPNGEPVPDFPASEMELRIEPPCQNPVVLHPDGPSNANGEVVWGVDKLDQGGGSCTGPAVVQVWIQNILFAIRNQVTSPDENGDGQVALDDLVTFQQAFVSQMRPHQGDLDLDGVIALSDLTFFQRHFTAR